MISFYVKHRAHPLWRKKGKKRGVYPWIEVEEHGKYAPFRVLGMLGKHEVREIEFFRIKTLAQALDRTPETLILWEKKELFPKPVLALKDSKIRYYSAAQIINIHTVWAYKYKARTHPPSGEEFQAMLKAFRIIMHIDYVDRFIVDAEGNVDIKQDHRPDIPRPKGDDE